jgi:hypothetical protein
MEKLLILFGLLDFVAIIKSFQMMISLFESGKILYWTNIISVPLFFSLLFSGFFLFKSSNIGMWIYYVQFPFRLIYTIGLSFGFILLFSRLFPENKYIYLSLFILCAILEFARLIATILIHKREFHSA